MTEPDVSWVTASWDLANHLRVHRPARYFRPPIPRMVAYMDTGAFQAPRTAVSIWRTYPDWPDAPVNQAEAMAKLQASGSVVLVDADIDFLYKSDRAKAIGEQAAKLPGGVVVDYERDARIAEAYNATLTQADGAIVTTPAMARLLEGRGVRRIWVCPNPIDPTEWPEPTPRTGPFTVGCVGSWTHRMDLPLIRDAMAWAAERDDAQAVLFGEMNPKGDLVEAEDIMEADLIARQLAILLRGRAPEELVAAMFNSGSLKAVAEAERMRALELRRRAIRRRVKARGASWRFPYQHVPWTNDVGAYQASIGRLDVGLCPIIPNGFANLRADQKLMEYAMAGALPIVSDTIPYEAWKGTPVLFARDASEFLEHVRWAADHRAEVYARAMAVRELVLRDRSMPEAVEPWRVAVAEAAGVPSLACRI